MTRENSDYDRLESSRFNNVNPDNYTGPRPVDQSFDPVDLYCYLAEEPLHGPINIERIIAVFELDFHTLPDTAAGQMEIEWNTAVATGELNDPPTIHDAVNMFVTKYTKHYEARGETSPIGKPATAGEAIGTPGLSGTATAGERTGYAIGHFLKSAWNRLTTPSSTHEETTTGETTNK